MKAKKRLTVGYVSERLRYDADTGNLYWRHRPPEHFADLITYVAWNARHANTRAGSQSTQGYVRVNIEGRQYLAHRLAWLLHTGRWPTDQIDHIDGIKNNNAAINLREATGEQNQHNTPRHVNSTSGHKGVYWYKQTKKWLVQIQVANKNIHLGYFANFDDAKAARIAAAKKYHGEFART